MITTIEVVEIATKDKVRVSFEAGLLRIEGCAGIAMIPVVYRDHMPMVNAVAADTAIQAVARGYLPI